MSVPELKKSEKVFAKVMWDRTNKLYRTPTLVWGGCEKRGGMTPWLAPPRFRCSPAIVANNGSERVFTWVTPRTGHGRVFA